MLSPTMLGLLLCSLLFVSVTSHANNEIADESSYKFRLPQYAMPLNYKLRLEPHILGHNSSIDGEVSILVMVKTSTWDLTLHAKDLDIQQNLTTLENEDGIALRPSSHFLDPDTEMIHLIFNHTLNSGLYILNMTFSANAGGDLRGYYPSFYYDDDDNMVWIVATHFQPIAARRTFPCWDEPAIKATFDISVKHFRNYTALSNMPIKEQEVCESDGKIWSHFEPTPVMSTNIIGITVLSGYANVTSPSGFTRVWTRRNAIQHVGYALEVADKATNLLINYFQSGIGVPKIDHVSIPHYSSRATENWGMILYLERTLVYNGIEDKSTYKMDNILTIVHELSHQWFGNLVSPSWWKYYWLSEGLATHFKYYICDMLLKEWRLMDLFAVRVQQQAAFTADTRVTSPPMNQEVVTPKEIQRRDSYIVYRKSASILNMLRHMVSEAMFHEGLIKYTKKNAYKAVTSDHLWEGMQEAMDEAGHEPRFNVKEVMDSWVEQPGYPIVTFARNYELQIVTVRQNSVRLPKDAVERFWWVPLTYATQSNPNFTSTTPVGWLRPSASTTVIRGIHNDDWFIANLQQSGYYRVDYDENNWLMIAHFLNYGNFTNIHVVNRAQIVDDAHYLVTNGMMSPITFMKIIKYLSRETDYVVWGAAFNIMSNSSKYFRLPESGRLLKPFALSLMNNMIATIGYEEQPEESNFDKLARKEVLTWACKVGHKLCRAKATEKLIAYVTNPEENKVPADLKNWAFCFGMYQANQSIWNRYLELNAENLTNDVVEHLGCSKDPVIIRNYLEMSIDEKSPVSKVSFLRVITYLNQDVTTAIDTLVDFVIENWAKMREIDTNPCTTLKEVIWRLNSKEQFAKIKAFFHDVGIHNEVSTSYRERMVEKILEDVHLIRSLLEDIKKADEEEEKGKHEADGRPEIKDYKSNANYVSPEISVGLNPRG